MQGLCRASTGTAVSPVQNHQTYREDAPGKTTPTTCCPDLHEGLLKSLNLDWGQGVAASNPVIRTNNFEIRQHFPATPKRDTFGVNSRSHRALFSYRKSPAAQLSRRGAAGSVTKYNAWSQSLVWVHRDDGYGTRCARQLLVLSPLRVVPRIAVWSISAVWPTPLARKVRVVPSSVPPRIAVVAPSDSKRPRTS